jgi:hypothetical protein
MGHSGRIATILLHEKNGNTAVPESLATSCEIIARAQSVETERATARSASTRR